MILAILASLILWPAYVAVSLVLDLIGLVILLPLSYFTHTHKFRPSKVYPIGYKGIRSIDVWPGGWLTWLWGNEEDGISGPTWWAMANSAKGWRLWRSVYVWSALRNPTNNLRFVPLINPVIDPSRVRYRGNFVWQGPYAGYVAFPKLFGKTFRFWIGWKLKSTDVNGVPDDDMRKPRCGFALQFKRVS